ncbi:sulfur-oxidizing protein SoxY [Sphaerotilus hippei]|uniref:Sulfur-oxidizing protein SoxY n=1 Tax=Sphaerotilus hippei TaxID=744406 RepID=A0A318GZ93_9BURK|nr:quinoprotein dehydrogenase-associated SoxYZ-like carrier [Sphaerotilus hippei]PXW95587.1 sulfur-oxidizing protein SoxY [Sphaerotilus hippei]
MPIHRRAWLRHTGRLALAGGLGMPAWQGPRAAEPRGAPASPDDDAQQRPIWLKVRRELFGDRPIQPAGDELLRLELPRRAGDPAFVPLVIRIPPAQAAGRLVRRLWLLIDENPSPIAAIVTPTLASGRADLETRVRVDAYSWVRVVIEIGPDDPGAASELHAVQRFVKASGGCSAAAAADAEQARRTLGQMRLQLPARLVAGQPALLRWQISHPNHSGLAMDPLSRQFTPAHWVRQVLFSDSDRPLLSADVDFSLSENPRLDLHFVPRERGLLQVRVEDSAGLAFRLDQPYQVQP